MHFTIPYVEEVTDSNGKKVDIFKIYINGAHHCSARFSVLHKLNEDLKLRFLVTELPYFPPKKFLKLNDAQLEERRESLEYFLQKVSSSTRFNSHEFHEFLKTCQKETKKIVNESVSISVYLMDGQQYQMDIQNTDNTQAVFDAFADAISLPRQISSKFGLFFMEMHPADKFSIIRKIQDFEYPYISLNEILTERRNRNRNSSDNNCRIVVRKSQWNSELETDIDSSYPALEILFAQVAAEIHNGWISIPDESRRNRIQNLIQRKARKEALQLARTLDFYGYVQLHGRSICNRPAQNSHVIVSAGNFQLVLRDGSDSNGNRGAVLVTYCLTRIKAWKISTSLKDRFISDGDNNRLSPSQERQGCPTLTFEYLDVNTKTLEEVIITNSYTDQIILLSMSLKNMAEEYVNYKASVSQSSISSDSESKLVKHKASPYGGSHSNISSGNRANLMSSYYIGDGDL